MARVVVSQPLRRYAGNLGEHEVEGATVGEALHALAARHPELACRLFRQDGSLAALTVVYLEDRDIRLLEGDQTPLLPAATIRLFVPLAGG